MGNRRLAKERIGTKWITSGGNGRECTVIGYENTNEVTIQFPCRNTKVVTWDKLRKGEVKDEGRPTASGIGCYGFGPYSHKEHPKVYTTWQNMIQRCYVAQPNAQRTNSTYYNLTTVSEEFKNFQTFAEWSLGQKGIHLEKPMLDKDLIIKGNKVYSREACCYVPHDLNAIVTLRQNDRGDFPLGVTWNKAKKVFIAQCNIMGKRKALGNFATPEEAFAVYKAAKEAEIKRVAGIWRDQIDEYVYEALLNFKIEITD